MPSVCRHLLCLQPFAVDRSVLQLAIDDTNDEARDEDLYGFVLVGKSLSAEEAMAGVRWYERVEPYVSTMENFPY
jgi:hypothetical protein